MPTQQELAERYDVAPGTIDKALGVLRDLGIAETIHGMGTFVREAAPTERDLAAEVRRLSARYEALADRVGKLEDERHVRP